MFNPGITAVKERISMKKCPVCQSVVDDKTACKICGTTLTYESYVDSDKEHFARNKYVGWFWLKKCIFPFLVTVITAVLLLKSGTLNEMSLFSIIAVLICCLESLFSHKIVKHIQWKYAEQYAAFVVKASILGAAIIGIVLAAYTAFI